MSASRSDSRAITTAAGIVGGRGDPASGSGSSHETSPGATGLGGRSGPSYGPVRPEGSIRIRRGCQRRQADVGGDRVEPGPDRRAALEAGVGPPRPQIRLLHQVLGVVRRADHAVAVRQQLPAEPLGLGGEPVVDRLPIAPRLARHPRGRVVRAAGPVCRRWPWLPAPRAPSGRRPGRRRWGEPGSSDAGGDERGQLAHDLAEDLRRGLDQHAEVEADDVDLVLVHQVPVGDRGFAARHAVDDDPAGDPLGRGQAGARRWRRPPTPAPRSTPRAAGQPQHLGGEVAAARVQDVVGARAPAPSRACSATRWR